ncbi:helix-turn-helix transcriptional regulator [Cysteiniphilum sp. JM-1]|uniref:helix-turn-helix transcriptional regulator n=1 Tax=Cysteiniphilum sp. JM-1 TaxID=2610891 RepID=UPI0012443EA4|nr:helix-turn-helix transcriptional regulator [Cysteiniphilum sp. JM-1]
MSISKNKLSAAQAISEITGHLYFGDMVKSLRMCENISQAEMARSIGISRQYLCNIESGERKADVELALKFAEYLKHPKEFFISRLLEDQLYTAGLDYTITLKAS